MESEMEIQTRMRQICTCRGKGKSLHRALDILLGVINGHFKPEPREVLRCQMSRLRAVTDGQDGKVGKQSRSREAWIWFEIIIVCGLWILNLALLVEEWEQCISWPGQRRVPEHFQAESTAKEIIDMELTIATTSKANTVHKRAM